MNDLNNKERTGRWGKYWYIQAIDRDGFDVHGAGGILTWKTTWLEAWDECQRRSRQDEGDLQHVPDCPCCGSEMYWHQEYESRSWWQCKGCGQVEWQPCEDDTDEPPLTAG